MIITFDKTTLAIISTTVIAHPPLAGQGQILLPPGIKYPLIHAEEIPDTYSYLSDSQPTQPVLEKYWKVGTKIHTEAPMVPAWEKDGTLTYESPAIIKYCKGEVCLTEMPTQPAYYCPVTSAVYYTKPEGIATDSIWIFDNSYKATSFPDESFTPTTTLHPEAVEASGPDPRYILIQAHTKYSVKEDVVRLQKDKISSILKRSRVKWEEMKERIAIENTLLGITESGKTAEVALAFKEVEYFLSMNSPKAAASALLSIAPIVPYITEEKKQLWAAEFEKELI